MTLVAFDHVNVRTAKLDAMVAWYADVLDMHTGPRPDFNFPGAWLYLGDQAIIHLVGLSGEPQTQDPRIEHFALRAKGLSEFLARMEEKNVPVALAEVPGFGILQVNIHDPDGNHIHVDFDSSEKR
ncbi:MAG: VOC family protein [Rhodobacter sp.]|nr:VOC family protein [Rhodobacter sp.]